MSAPISGAKDEQMLVMPIKEDTLATEFSSILDDFKNNNKVNLALEQRGESRGRDIVKSLLQAAIKRGDQEEVRRGNDEAMEKSGDDTDEELKGGDEAGCEGDIHLLQTNEQQKQAEIPITISTLEVCKEVSKLEIKEVVMSNVLVNEVMPGNSSAMEMELEFLQEDEVENYSVQMMDSSKDQLQLGVDVKEHKAPESFEDGNIVEEMKEIVKEDQMEPAAKDAAEPGFKLHQGVFELTLESGKENIVVKSESDLVPLPNGEKRQWLETVSAPALVSLKHPLQHAWTFWHLNPDKNLKWSEKQQEIKTVGTVEDFWAVYNWTLFPSQLRPGSDYSLFKAGVRPDWEDERNVRGGRWMVIRSRDQVDHGWREIAMALVGETLGDGLDERVTGAVVNVRGKMDKIGVWVGDNNSVDRVGDRLKEVLGVSDRTWSQGAEYRRHK